MSTSIEIRNLSKHYGLVRAVDEASLEIRRGELFFLLGPSGCGKTTLLRMIAGFIDPTQGSIRFGDRDVTTLAPNKRNTGMVFQSYALWPHMTVRENVAFGLRVRKVSRSERDERVLRALRQVRMDPYAERKPGELSGGQQQRVALARALVVAPDVLLLDEPLSNLDAKLRLEMRHEIRELCTRTGITTVYVTHDQKEALSMADRMAVMRDGRVMQTGTPRDLYDRPASAFVAEFLGETNFIPGRITEANGERMLVETVAGRLEALRTESSPSDGEVVCSLRPEAFRIRANEHNSFACKSLQSVYLGDTAQHLVEGPGGVRLRIAQLHPASTGYEAPSEISIAPSDVVVLPSSDA